MANRWGNSGNSERLYFGGSNITADGDCSHEIKRCLLLGRKVMTNLDSILKSRDITLPTKVCLAKAMVFPVVGYGCESWTIKKAEHQRIDAFELWCWRRLLRVPWTARRSSQSILEEISPGCLLEGQMLKLKLQYFGHLMQRNGWMASQTQWTWVWVKSGSWWWTGRPGVLQAMVVKSRTRLSNWTTKAVLMIKKLSASAGRPKRHRFDLGLEDPLEEGMGNPL